MPTVWRPGIPTRMPNLQFSLSAVVKKHSRKWVVAAITP